MKQQTDIGNVDESSIGLNASNCPLSENSAVLGQAGHENESADFRRGLNGPPISGVRWPQSDLSESEKNGLAAIEEAQLKLQLCRLVIHAQMDLMLIHVNAIQLRLHLIPVLKQRSMVAGLDSLLAQIRDWRN